jgi:signal transduction histidine kinase
LLGLVVSAGLGTWLAVGISRPVRDVTQSIYALATGQRHEPLEETGPEELRSQARAVNFLVEQLHNLEQSRRQLLANLVHELGRPLGALRAAIHAVSKGADQDPVLFSDLMRGMDDETARLQHLLDDLANLYDKALGGLELDRQPVETVGWMRGVLRPWQAAAQEKRLGWQENIPAELPPISIDSMRMAQVIGNLLSNAIKYTPPGGSVAVSAGVREGEFWFKVSDSGLGIKPEEREKIFQAFYRGDDGRRIKQGMGLGLTIARDLVSAHGGRIGMESEPGSGSTFTVYVPLV